jgi:hypothetical protein
VGNPAGRLLSELNNHMTGCNHIQKTLVVGSLAVGYSKCLIDGHLQPLTITVTDVSMGRNTYITKDVPTQCPAHGGA